MCDYSLHAVASRDAIAGETLVTTGFHGTSSQGFASPRNLEVAVCLRPGTELVFERYPRYMGRVWRKKARFLEASLCHVDVDDPQTHHDALQFPDGTIVKLNRLLQDQRARVVQLPARPVPTWTKPASEPVSLLDARQRI